MTNIQRVNRHLANEDGCSLCPHLSESPLPVPRTAQLLPYVWLKVVHKDLKSSFFFIQREAWLLDNLSSFAVFSNGLLWDIFFRLVCWRLWKRRNDRVFHLNSINQVDLDHVIFEPKSFYNDIIAAWNLNLLFFLIP